MSIDTLRFGCPPLTEPQIQALVAKAKRGHKSARDQLFFYIQKQTRTLAKVRKWVTHATPLEDIVQESVLRIDKMIANFDPEKGKTFWTYAQDWVVNVALPHINTARVDGQIPLSLDCPDEDGHFIQVEQPETKPLEQTPEQELQRSAFERAMLALRDWQQELFEMRFINGFTQMDIANLGKFGSRTTVQRKLKTLKDLFDRKVKAAIEAHKNPPISDWFKERILNRYEATQINVLGPETNPENTSGPLNRRDIQDFTGDQIMFLQWPTGTSMQFKQRWHGLVLLFVIALASVLLWQELSLAQPVPTIPGAGGGSQQCQAGLLSGVGTLLQGGLSIFDPDVGRDACGVTQGSMAVIFFSSAGTALVGGIQAFRNNDFSAFIWPTIIILCVWIVLTLGSKLMLG